MLRIITLGLIVLASTGASAQSPEQDAALRALIDAALLEEYCPTMRVNQVTAGAVMLRYGLEPGDLGMESRFLDTMLEHMGEYMDQLIELPEETVCDVAELSFGPDGRSIKHLMTRR